MLPSNDQPWTFAAHRAGHILQHEPSVLKSPPAVLLPGTNGPPIARAISAGSATAKAGAAASNAAAAPSAAAGLSNLEPPRCTYATNFLFDFCSCRRVLHAAIQAARGCMQHVALLHAIWSTATHRSFEVDIQIAIPADKRLSLQSCPDDALVRHRIRRAAVCPPGECRSAAIRPDGCEWMQQTLMWSVTYH